MPEPIRCNPIKREIMAPAKEWLSAEDCAEWLGVSVSTINRLVRDGEFVKPGISTDGGDEGKAGRPGARRWFWADFWAWCHLRNAGYRVSRLESSEAPSNLNPSKGG